ncbi:hypothetical protein INR49_006471, partial [Caranx melampygus]
MLVSSVAGSLVLLLLLVLVVICLVHKRRQQSEPGVTSLNELSVRDVYEKCGNEEEEKDEEEEYYMNFEPVQMKQTSEMAAKDSDTEPDKDEEESDEDADYENTEGLGFVESQENVQPLCVSTNPPEPRRVSGSPVLTKMLEHLPGLVFVRLQQPTISLTSPDGGLVWSPEAAQVTRGYSFIITCFISSHYPAGVFSLIISGSNTTVTKPAINHSASFEFLAAEYEHQGNYS